MSIIYVLLCEGERYYIGKTNRKIEERIEEHFTNNGSYWTKKYKPIKVVEMISSDDNMDEDKYTKKYMLMYGIDKVRGGSYTEMILPKYKLLCLRDELCTIDDLCFRCMRRGHFIDQCYAKTTIDGVLIESDEGGKKSYTICDRCGRNGHSVDNCYAKSTVDGISTNVVDVANLVKGVGKVASWLCEKLSWK